MDAITSWLQNFFSSIWWGWWVIIFFAFAFWWQRWVIKDEESRLEKEGHDVEERYVRNFIRYMRMDVVLIIALLIGIFFTLQLILRELKGG